VIDPAPDRTRAVLHNPVAGTAFWLHRFAPDPALAPFVEVYWTVRWDLRGQEPQEQRVLPHPVVHLVVGRGRPAVQGVIRGSYTHPLREQGRAIGAAFRPGGFYPYLRAPVASLTDQRFPVEKILDWIDPDALERDVSASPDDAGMAVALEAALLVRLPERDPVAEEVGWIVRQVAADPSLTRVELLAERLGTGTRRLQRLFERYVGVGPKRVIRRYRLHEAAQRAAQGTDQDWAALASELGYSDQAHFTRDFTALVGSSPARYAKRAAASQPVPPRAAAPGPAAPTAAARHPENA
jgi:AraC-like DNA-binding protein